jgi:hypothetical protein
METLIGMLVIFGILSFVVSAKIIGFLFKIAFGIVAVLFIASMFCAVNL